MKKYTALFFIISLSAVELIHAAEQSNFNRSRVPHSWNAAQLSSGHDVKSSLGDSYRGVLSLQFDYVKNPYKLVDQNGDLLSEVVSDFSRVRLGFGGHINRTWFVGLSLPFDNVKSKPFTSGQQHPDILTDEFSQSYSGIGDIELMVRRRLEGLSLRWNWVVESLITLPTGDVDSFNRDGDLSVALRLAFSRVIGRDNQSTAYGYLGGRYAKNSRLDIDPLYFPFEAEKRLEFGLGIRNQLTRDFALFGEFGGFLSFPFDDGQNPVELSIGFDASFEKSKTWKVYGGLGLEGIAGDQFSNDERYYLGLKKLLMPLSEKQTKKFRETKYPAYSSSYDMLLDSVHSETSIVKKIIGKSHTVFFYSGSSKLNPDSELGMIDLVSHLIRHSDKILKINVVGFADSDGNETKNKELSQRRAQTVGDLLINYGLPASKISISYHGAEKSGREADSFGKLNNRRAEVYIQELTIPNINFPKGDVVRLKRPFSKSFEDSTTSRSYIRDKFFPKPFVFNKYHVQAFTILTQDNLTWRQVSEQIYGSKKMSKILKSLNYNRKPALGDVVYFPTGTKSIGKIDKFYFMKW